jgi:hypothetical protein
MSNALKKITNRAKEIRRKQPGIAWKTAIKKAGAEYRGSAKKGKPKAAGSKRKRPSTNKGTSTVGAGSSPITQVKQQLRDQLGRALLTKELSRKKTDKRKAQKRISELRGKLRKAESL